MTKDWQIVAEKVVEKNEESFNSHDDDLEKNVTTNRLQADEEKQTAPALSKALEDKLEKAQEKIIALQNDIVRGHAELDNVRRRAERDVSAAHKYALEKFINELLPVIDSLERSLEIADGADPTLLQNFRAGIELTLSMFTKLLKKFDVQAVNPVAEPFNPTHHQAMAVEEQPDVKSQTVLKVVQKGYLLKDRLLRPALVIVAK